MSATRSRAGPAPWFPPVPAYRWQGACAVRSPRGKDPLSSRRLGNGCNLRGPSAATRVRHPPSPNPPIMSTATSNPPARVFYGWYVVAAVFVITTTSSGLAFYNLSILLAAFVAEQGFPVGLASSATATFFTAGSIGGVIAGRLVDRIDARIVIATGASIGALTLATAGAARGAVAALCLPRRVRSLPRRQRPRARDDGGCAMVQRAPRARLLHRVDRPLVRRHPGSAVRGAGYRAHGPEGRLPLVGARHVPRHRAGGADRAPPKSAGTGPGARWSPSLGRRGPRATTRRQPSPRRCAAATSTPSRSRTCFSWAPRSARSPISIA